MASIIFVLIIVAIVAIAGVIQLWKKNPELIRIVEIIAVVIVIAGVIFLLSFHVIPSRQTIFPKENLSFSNTLITERDIDDLIKRYNDASWVERLTIAQEPLHRKLIEKGIIVTVETNNYESY